MSVLSDAIRGTARYKGYRLDIFASSIVNPVTGTWDHHLQGNNLHGAYGGIDKLGPRLIVEPYVLWRMEHGLKNERNVISKLNEKIGGLAHCRQQTARRPGLRYWKRCAKIPVSLGLDKYSDLGRALGRRTHHPGCSLLRLHVYAEYNSCRRRPRNRRTEFAAPSISSIPRDTTNWGSTIRSAGRRSKTSGRDWRPRREGNVTAALEIVQQLVPRQRYRRP